MVDMEQLELIYFQNNKPVPYLLQCGVEILIYPIRLEDWSVFYSSLTVFTTEKVEYDDLDILKLPYIDFLKFLIKQNEVNEAMIYNVLSQSLKEKNIAISQSNGKSVIAILDEEDLIKSIITSKEMEEIKKIILKQNIYNYDDRYISPDIKKEIDAYNKIRYKGVVQPNFEKEKVFVMSKSGISEDALNKMYYRTFSLMFRMMVDNDIYFANKMMESSPKYDVKEGSVHPLFAKEDDGISSAFTSSDKLKNKIK